MIDQVHHPQMALGNQRTFVHNQITPSQQQFNSRPNITLQPQLINQNTNAQYLLL